MQLASLLAVGFFLALFFALALTWGVRESALRIGLVDVPDGRTKSHARPTPDLGGVALFLATALALVISVRLANFNAPILDLDQIAYLGTAGITIWALGLVDDLVGLSPWLRLAIEFAVAGTLVLLGARIQIVGLTADDANVLLSGSIIVATIVWIVGVTNAFNLLDGSDGVAGGAALCALLTLGALSFAWGQGAAALLSFILAGAVLGFLFFNFPPASIFLGDSGSLFLGFCLASLGILTTQGAPVLLATAIPLVALGVPVLDTTLAIVRRLLRGQPVFKADRGHIHHRLRDLGCSPREAALILWALTATLCLFAMILAGGQTRTAAIALGAVGVGIILFVQRLRIPELLELARLLRSRQWRARMEHGVRLRRTADRVSSVDTPAELLKELQEGFIDSGFAGVALWLSDAFGEPVSGHVGLEASLADTRRGDRSAVGRNDQCRAEIRLTVFDNDGGRLAGLTLIAKAAGQGAIVEPDLITAHLLPALRRAVLRFEPRHSKAPTTRPPDHEMVTSAGTRPIEARMAEG